jgi:orotate phosphoribosyltransferase
LGTDTGKVIMGDLLPYQRELLSLLLTTKTLTFGDFTLKSGRKSPYFFNFGAMCHASHLQTLGRCYAHLIAAHEAPSSVVLFGPSYKGIPLAISASLALQTHEGFDVSYVFNRKEAKTRGEGGLFVGKIPTPQERLFLIDDVVTGGTTTREIFDLVETHSLPRPHALFLAVDRQERGTSTSTATEELRSTFDLPVHSILSMNEILTSLPQFLSLVPSLEVSHLERCREYLSTYGGAQ